MAKKESMPKGESKSSKTSVKNATKSSNKPKARRILSERSFIVRKSPENIQAMVEKLGWTTFLKHPKAYSPSLVKEFYDGIPKDDTTGKPCLYSMVRGTKVAFDSKTINKVYNLEYNGKEFENRVANIKSSDMNLLLKKFTMNGTSWEKNSGNNYRVRKTSLKALPKLWYDVIGTKILPTSHTLNVTKKRFVLLASIIEGKPIDIGRLISREMSICGTKSKGSLFFPCLITQLCTLAKVGVYSNELTGVVKGAFSTSLQEKSEIYVLPAAFDATLVLQHLLQHHRAFWKFSKEHYMWEQQMFAANFKGKSVGSPPKFPDWLLENVDIAESSQGRKEGKKDMKGKKQVVKEELFVNEDSENEESEERSDSENEESEEISDNEKEQEEKYENEGEEKEKKNDEERIEKNSKNEVVEARSENELKAPISHSPKPPPTKKPTKKSSAAAPGSAPDQARKAASKKSSSAAPEKEGVAKI